MLRIKVEGTCCWRVFNKPNFRGLTQIFDLSEDKEIFQSIGSVEKVDCQGVR